MWRHALDLVVGTIIVAAIYFSLANLPLPVMAIAYLLGMIVGGFNGILFIVVVIMLVTAAWWRRPGIALAPFVFAGLWYASAVAERREVAAHEDPKLAERPVPSDLRSVRTLIIESQVTQLCCGQSTLLADGLIDRYVHVSLDDDHKVRGITATTLGRGGECSVADRERSTLLIRAGRTDECLRSETIDGVPDGVVVRMIPFARAYAAMGCCNRGTISLRSGGTETLQATWHYGKRAVRSFLPVFGTHGWGEPVPLWSQGSGGPMQLIEIGGPAFHHEDLAGAVYGIDWRAPLKVASAGASELAARAVALVNGTPHERQSALDLALTVQDQGFVNDELLGVVAAFVHRAGQGLTTTEKIMRFWSRLDDNRKRAFIEKVFARLEDPAEGADFNESTLYIHLPPEKFPGAADRAANIFTARDGLKPWQYELALRLANNAQMRVGRTVPETRQRMFAVLRDDDSEAFGRRAVAFKRVFPGWEDAERDVFSRKLNLVPDALLQEYLGKTGWNRWHTESGLTPATRDYRERAAVRIAAIKDEQLRSEAQRRFLPDRPN